MHSRTGRSPSGGVSASRGLVRRAVHEGKIRKSRGALFVAIVKRACADRGIPMAVSQPLYAGRS
jgi:hypothetical protein